MHKQYTPVSFNYEFDDIFELPLRICDLSNCTQLAFKLYNMDSIDDAPLASTVLDLVDSRGCLRQGTWNCVLHEGKLPDYSLVETPALPDTPDCLAINNMLKLIQKGAEFFELDTDLQSFRALGEKMYNQY